LVTVLRTIHAQKKDGERKWAGKTGSKGDGRKSRKANT